MSGAVEERVLVIGRAELPGWLMGAVLITYVGSVYLLETTQGFRVFSAVQATVLLVGVGQIVLSGRIIGGALLGWFIILLAYATLMAMTLELGITAAYRTFFVNCVVMICFIQMLSSRRRLELAMISVGAWGAVASGLIVTQVDTGMLALADLNSAYSFRGGANLPGGNPNVAGMYLAIAFVLSMGLAITRPRPKVLRLSMALLAMLNLVGVTATGSRNAVLFCVIGLLVLVAVTSWRLLPIAGLFLWGGYYALENIRPLYLLMGHRFLGLGGASYSDELRIKAAVEAVSAILSHPFGVGLGSSSEYLSYLNYTHSNYLEVFLTLGVFGGLFFYLLYFRLAGALLRGPSKVSPILLAALLALLIYEIFQVTYLYKGPLLLLALIVAHNEVYQPTPGELGQDQLDGRGTVAVAPPLNGEGLRADKVKRQRVTQWR